MLPLKPIETVLWHPSSADPAEAIREAADEYRRNHNPLVALKGAELALMHGLPVPSIIAQWLLHGLSRPPIYDRSKAKPVVRGRMTIEQALGLKATGAGNVLARARREQEERAALGSMMMLHTYGATIPQAALLVSRLSPRFSVSTLESKYRRGGYSQGVKELQRTLLLEGLERVLAEYPDRPADLVQCKNAIRAKHEKVRASRT